jgi:hypothetical protein
MRFHHPLSIFGPCTGFVAKSSKEKLHADSFSIMALWALMMVPVEHFCEVFTGLGSPMGLIFSEFVIIFFFISRVVWV